MYQLDYIYTIECPIKKEVIYVGKTDNPYARFPSHLNNRYSEIGKYVRNLIKNGHKPIFRIVYMCDWEDSLKIEQRFIIKYLKQGCKLLNIIHNKDFKNNNKTEVIDDLFININELDYTKTNYTK